MGFRVGKIHDIGWPLTVKRNSLWEQRSANVSCDDLLVIRIGHGVVGHRSITASWERQILRRWRMFTDEYQVLRIRRGSAEQIATWQKTSWLEYTLTHMHTMHTIHCAHFNQMMHQMVHIICFFLDSQFCPVRPFVCLSHACFVTKRKNILPTVWYRMKEQSSSFLIPTLVSR